MLKSIFDAIKQFFSKGEKKVIAPYSGYEAFYQGYDLLDNPFHLYTDEYEQWCNNWHTAKDDSKWVSNI